ncbi:hypothetical protein CDV51_12300 [Haematobacter massiliensis]|nr:hypothetical protein CDV51_12300 [Haematobacter massiliensis]
MQTRRSRRRKLPLADFALPLAGFRPRLAARVLNHLQKPGVAMIRAVFAIALSFAGQLAVTAEAVAQDVAGALRPNQAAVARAVSGMDPEGPLPAALAGLSPSGTRLAYSMLSGEGIASARMMLLDDSAFLSRGILRRGSGTVETSAFGEAGLFWLDGESRKLHASGDGNFATSGFRSSGIRLGADSDWQGLRAGIAIGYNDSSFDSRDRHTSATANGLHAGVYALGERAGWNLTGGWTYARYDLDEDRAVPLQDTMRVRGSSSASAHRLFAEATRPVQLQVVEVEPVLGLTQTFFHSERFRERGTIAALAVDDQDAALTTLRLGARGIWNIDIGPYPMIARLGAGWEGNMGDRSTPLSAAFAGSPACRARGSELPENLLDVEASVSIAALRNGTVQMGYGGRFGDDFEDHRGRVTVEIRF